MPKLKKLRNSMDKAKQFKMVWYRLDREVEIQNVADHFKKNL